MAEYKQTCLRCGLCCKGQYCLVPRFEHSNLDPAHLEHIRVTYGAEAVSDYRKKNSIPQGNRCLWLKDNPDRTTTCMAYERRSATCRDFNSDGGCTIWMQAFGLG